MPGEGHSSPRIAYISRRSLHSRAIVAMLRERGFDVVDPFLDEFRAARNKRGDSANLQEFVNSELVEAIVIDPIGDPTAHLGDANEPRRRTTPFSAIARRAITSGVPVVLIEPTPRRRAARSDWRDGCTIVGGSVSIDHFVEAIETSIRSARPQPPSGRSTTVSAEWRRRFDLLTPREREVLAALAGGASPSAIAASRLVAVSTVRSQVKSIYRKLGVRSQLAAAAVAHEAGLVARPHLSHLE